MGNPTLVAWPYRFDRFESSSWEPRFNWVTKAFLDLGFDIHKHPKFKCNIPGSQPYQQQHTADVVLYNHCIMPDIRGDVVQAKLNVVFKPTIPDEKHATLDTMGYGAYSSVAYKRPDFDFCDGADIATFFETKVKDWVAQDSSKWGSIFMPYPIDHDDYHLFLVQTTRDDTVNRMYFGDYVKSVEQLLIWITGVDDRRVVVKLHPRETYGGGAVDGAKASLSLLEHRLSVISDKIQIVSGPFSVHGLLKNCRDVILCNSSSGFEAMMHGKPIISYGFPEYHWVTFDLRHIAHMEEALSLDWFNAADSNAFLYWYLEQHAFYDQESATRRVKELVDEM